jgi:Glycosyl-hydrolase 97 C-terminal, oligomerisation/Glycoside hydrolase 97
VDGFKADFWNWGPDLPDAADKVALQQYVLQEAASNHLLVVFHGIREPMGEFRTYPNLIQWKALMARDYHPQAWQGTTIPLVRWLVGPADFGAEDGSPYDYEVASLIAMPGPAIILSQRSDKIALNAFASLIVSIPNQWDQTIVLPQSQLGQTVAMARRKGQDWYIGIMNGNLDPPESWAIPLAFLTHDTNYQADLIYQGASGLVRTNVTSQTTLSITDTNLNLTASGAGFVAHLYPSPAAPARNSLLTGTIIGTPGSWNNSGNTITKVFDGNLNTFFDGPDASGDWVGLDLGSANQQIVASVRYCPRSGNGSRMVGGVFQGANNSNFNDAVTLASIGYYPQDGVFTSAAVTNKTVFRYVRYLGPPGGYCNVAEIQILAPTLNYSWYNGQLTLSWGSGGILLEATNLPGPWTTNTAATSPYTVQPTLQQEYFRVLWQ